MTDKMNPQITILLLGASWAGATKPAPTRSSTSRGSCATRRSTPLTTMLCWSRTPCAYANNGRQASSGPLLILFAFEGFASIFVPMRFGSTAT